MDTKFKARLDTTYTTEEQWRRSLAATGVSHATDRGEESAKMQKQLRLGLTNSLRLLIQRTLLLLVSGK